MGGGGSEYPLPSRMRNSQTFSCACVRRGRHSKFEDFQDGHLRSQGGAMGAMAMPLVQKGGAMLSFGQPFAKSDILS